MAKVPSLRFTRAGLKIKTAKRQAKFLSVIHYASGRLLSYLPVVGIAFWCYGKSRPEDRNRTRKDNAPEHLAILRKLALNMIPTATPRPHPCGKSNARDGTTPSSLGHALSYAIALPIPRVFRMRSILFCSFLALATQKCLEDRSRQAGIVPEWKTLLRDLDRLQHVRKSIRDHDHRLRKPRPIHRTTNPSARRTRGGAIPA